MKGVVIVYRNRHFGICGTGIKKNAIRRLGIMPRPCGEVFGERCKWVVLFGLLEHTSQSYRKEPDPVPEPHKTTPKMRLSDYVEIIEEDEDIGT